MIVIERCVNNKGCVMITLNGHVSPMTEEEQTYFINWMRKNKPELLK
jgi:hypothetical protein